jgi:hypothetical protein
MKKQFAISIICALVSVSAYCQNHERDRLVDVLNEYALNKQLKYEPSKVKGSPYLNKMYAPATVSGVTGNAMMRYDVFNDEFEFVNSTRDTLVLNKVEPYNSITFTITNTNYKLVNYNAKGKATKGYLIWLYEKNNLTLFKKQNIIYTKERMATSGFDKSTPATFDRAEDTYYFKNGNNGISEFPANKKGLLKLFPEKKTELETFFKQNKIDFEKDSDVIKVAGFLAG